MPEFLSAVDLSTLRLDLLGRLLLAALLGGAVGIEREWNGKPAGFRTNLLICTGAALLTELSVSVALLAEPPSVGDPARIAAQIVSGIGFLGAGTIIQSRGSVTGLTTAATLWVVAAIGMAVGVHAYTEAVGTTVLVILALLLLGRVEPFLSRRVERVIRVRIPRDGEVQDAVESVIGDGMKYQVTELKKDEEHLVIAYAVEGRRRQWHGLAERLLDVEGVDHVLRG